MGRSTDSYSISAKHYDSAYAVKSDLVDAPFYLDLAKKSRGPVLEIACGTGRVLLPIARAGIHIHGVDNSSPMLRILRTRLNREPPNVRGHVHLHAGDMRRFRLKRKFPLVIIPFRPLQHMYTLDDQIAALRTAAFHLQGKGILAFDVFYPKWEAISAGIGRETPELEWPDPQDPSKIIRRFFKKLSVDKINQTFTGCFIFRTFQGENLVHEESEPLKLSFYTYPQLLALFRLSGLEIVREFGSFDKSPINAAAQQMIFLLRRAKSSRV